MIDWWTYAEILAWGLGGFALAHLAMWLHHQFAKKRQDERRPR